MNYENKKALLIIFVLTIFLIPINVFAVRQEKIIEIDEFTTFEINGVKYAVNDPEQTIEKGSTIYVDIIDENSSTFHFELKISMPLLILIALIILILLIIRKKKKK